MQLEPRQQWAILSAVALIGSLLVIVTQPLFPRIDWSRYAGDIFTTAPLPSSTSSASFWTLWMSATSVSFSTLATPSCGDGICQEDFTYLISGFAGQLPRLL